PPRCAATSPSRTSATPPPSCARTWRPASPARSPTSTPATAPWACPASTDPPAAVHRQKPGVSRASSVPVSRSEPRFGHRDLHPLAQRLEHSVRVLAARHLRQLLLQRRALLLAGLLG